MSDHDCPCGKRRYVTHTGAIAAALHCSFRRGVPLRVYPCPHGPGWHLTSVVYMARPERTAS